MSFMTLHKQTPLPTSEQYPLFNRISLETMSMCNRSCSFCPISTGRRDFPIKYIDQEIVDQVCEDLGSVDWAGVFQLFLLNEPLLDKNLRMHASHIRREIPRCTIYVSTNGDPIIKQRDPLKYLEMLYSSGINVINMNVYDSGPDQYREYRQLTLRAVRNGVCNFTEHKYARHRPTGRYITYTDMRLERIEEDASLTDMWYDRTTEDRHVGVPQRHCARPNRHIVVLYNGKVPICCAIDPTDPDVPTVGDLHETRLLDLWQHEMFMKYRWFLQQKKRVLPGCDDCTHRMAWPWAVRHVAPTSEEQERWETDLATHEHRRDELHNITVGETD